MIFTGGAYFLFQYLVPGTNHKGELSEIWKIALYPYSLFWFLPSLFIVFFLVGMIDIQLSGNSSLTSKTQRRKGSIFWYFLSSRLRTFAVKEKFSKHEKAEDLFLANKSENPERITFLYWGLGLFFSIGLLQLRDLFIPETSLNFFSYKGAIYLLPFFITGMMIKRFESFFSQKKMTILFLIILFAGLGYQQLAWYQVVPGVFDRQGAIGLVIGIAAIILLFKTKWELKWLAWIGGFSYTIFLFHGFGTAGGRILLKSGGICNPFVIFTASLAAGLLVPIFAEFILERTRLTRWLFLGKPRLKRS